MHQSFDKFLSDNIKDAEELEEYFAKKGWDKGKRHAVCTIFLAMQFQEPIEQKLVTAEEAAGHTATALEAAIVRMHELIQTGAAFLSRPAGKT